MSLKAKLFTTISLMCLTIAMLMVGVWAVKTADFKVGGNISFTATGINATISQGVVSDTGSWVTSSDADEKLKEIVLNTDKTTAQIEQEFLSWQDLDLLFNEAGDNVTITFSISNNSTNADEYVAVNVNVNGGIMTNATANINTSSVMLAPSQSQEFVITFSVTDKTANASLTGFEIVFDMELITPVEASETPFTFSYSDETTTADAGEVSTLSTKATETLTASITDCDTSVTEVEIPMLVRNDGKTYLVNSIADGTSTTGAFYGCNSLTSITIPNNITSVGKYAFYKCSGLTSVIIECGVTSIGNNSFYNCTGLASIEIPDSVISLGEKAFNGCSRLTSMNYLGTLKDWASISFGDSYSNPTYYTKSLVINGEAITSITAEDLAGATSIGSYAFYKCSGLASIEIPDSVTSIGEDAFLLCSGLKSMNYLGTLKDWLSISFGNYSSSPTSYTKSLVINGETITSITAEDLAGVTKIGSCAFYNCTGLTSIEIPSSVTSIGKDAFGGCTGLISMNYLGTIKDWVSISFEDDWANPTSYTKSLVINGETITSITAEDLEGVTSIGSCAFEKCTGLTSIEIPNSVTSIGSYAFHGCTGLTSIEIPSGVTSIGGHAFYECTGLTSIEILGSVTTSIGESAFADCSGLKSVTIGSGVASIGKYAFNKCTSLTSVIIPASVTSIGNNAFYACSALTTVVIDSSKVASGLTAKAGQGYLIYYATKVYVKSGLSAGSSLTAYFTVGTSDKEGYVLYNKV